MTQVRLETIADIDDGKGVGEIARLPSHVPGLDTILAGGFLQGGLYMIQGPPGAGKTILANQILFNHAARDCRGVFITVLGENHGRMMVHLSPMRFFNPDYVPDRIAYLSAYRVLEEDGLDGLSLMIRREVLARKATSLVLDGLSAVATKPDGGLAAKQFTHQLQTLASATNCTMFLLTTVSVARSAPENTMVDGMIELRQQPRDVRNERRLTVHKLRGSLFLEGDHAYRISRDGITVFPRLEAQLATPRHQMPFASTRLSTGIPSLDPLFFGQGLPAASSTAVLGPSGVGKTTLALHFLSRSNAVEPGLWFGCVEPPERLRLKAERMGFDLAGAEERGEIEILWRPVGEHILDELAHQLLDAVQRRGVRRLVIDGMASFEQATFEPERIGRFWSALINELRGLGVTTLHTLEFNELVGSRITVPLGGPSALSDVIIVLRYVESRSRLFRLISLFKCREGAFDPSLREFTISDEGLVVGEPFDGDVGRSDGKPESDTNSLGVSAITSNRPLASRTDPSA